METPPASAPVSALPQRKRINVLYYLASTLFLSANAVPLLFVIPLSNLEWLLVALGFVIWLILMLLPTRAPSPMRKRDVFWILCVAAAANGVIGLGIGIKMSAALVICGVGLLLMGLGMLVMSQHLQRLENRVTPRWSRINGHPLVNRIIGAGLLHNAVVCLILQIRYVEVVKETVV